MIVPVVGGGHHRYLLIRGNRPDLSGGETDGVWMRGRAPDVERKCSTGGQLRLRNEDAVTVVRADRADFAAGRWRLRRRVRTRVVVVTTSRDRDCRASED